MVHRLRRWSDIKTAHVVSLMVHRLRRWPSVKTPFNAYLVFPGLCLKPQISEPSSEMIMGKVGLHSGCIRCRPLFNYGQAIYFDREGCLCNGEAGGNIRSGIDVEQNSGKSREISPFQRPREIIMIFIGILK